MTDPRTAAGRPLAARALAEVSDGRPLGSLVWLTLEVPGWPGARPGQFALLQAEDSRCFLGRALSVASQEGEVVSFLIAPMGEGTHELCSLRKGERVWVVGPLGNGFDVEALTASNGRLLVVAGGVGVAPFPLLLTRLGERQNGGRSGARLEQIVLLLGFRDRAQAMGAEPVLETIAALERQGMSCRVEVVTEDGSVGRAERVSDTLQRELRRGDRLAVCGPCGHDRGGVGDLLVHPGRHRLVQSGSGNGVWRRLVSWVRGPGRGRGHGAGLSGGPGVRGRGPLWLGAPSPG